MHISLWISDSYEEKDYSLTTFSVEDNTLQIRNVYRQELPPTLGNLTVLGVQKTVSSVTLNGNAIHNFNYDAVQKVSSSLLMSITKAQISKIFGFGGSFMRNSFWVQCTFFCQSTIIWILNSSIRIWGYQIEKVIGIMFNSNLKLILFYWYFEISLVIQ